MSVARDRSTSSSWSSTPSSGCSDQATQVRCFGNVAKRLKPDGAFLIEAFVPDLARFQRDRSISLGEVGLDRVRLDAERHDPVAQRITSQTIFLSNGSIDLRPIQIRYAWPSELDLMAQLAGLRLHARWSNWSQVALRRVQLPARLGLRPRRHACITPRASARGPRRERSSVSRTSSSYRETGRWRSICVPGRSPRGCAVLGGRRAAAPRRRQCSRPSG